MGLDMYLRKKKKSCKRTIDEICNGDYEEYKRDFKEIGYWRKANHIHKWFVDNIQNGVDDCGYYIVDKNKIKELVHDCIEILNNCKLVDKNMLLREYYQNGEKIKEYGIGKMVDNTELCEKLLPTQSGFFFGGTEFDEWYLKDVEYTYNRLCAILDIVDFDEDDIYYHSSW